MNMSLDKTLEQLNQAAKALRESQVSAQYDEEYNMFVPVLHKGVKFLVGTLIESANPDYSVREIRAENLKPTLGYISPDGKTYGEEVSGPAALRSEILSELVRLAAGFQDDAVLVSSETQAAGKDWIIDQGTGWAPGEPNFRDGGWLTEDEWPIVEGLKLPVECLEDGTKPKDITSWVTKEYLDLLSEELFSDDY